LIIFFVEKIFLYTIFY